MLPIIWLMYVYGGCSWDWKMENATKRASDQEQDSQKKQ